jgi:hypothetical protein
MPLLSRVGPPGTDQRLHTIAVMEALAGHGDPGFLMMGSGMASRTPGLGYPAEIKCRTTRRLGAGCSRIFIAAAPLRRRALPASHWRWSAWPRPCR